jgi:hypothetical protein
VHLQRKPPVKRLLNKNSNYVSLVGDLFYFMYLKFVIMVTGLSGRLRGPALWSELSMWHLVRAVWGVAYHRVVIDEYGATVEWWLAGKTEELREHASVPLFSLCISFEDIRFCTRVSAVRSQRLAAWACGTIRTQLRPIDYGNHSVSQWSVGDYAIVRLASGRPVTATNHVLCSLKSQNIC